MKTTYSDETVMEEKDLYTLSKYRLKVQKTRIQISNRLSSYERAILQANMLVIMDGGTSLELIRKQYKMKEDDFKKLVDTIPDDVRNMSIEDLNGRIELYKKRTERLTVIFDQILLAEKTIEKQIKKLPIDDEIVEYLSGIKGIGVILASEVASHIKNINRFVPSDEEPGIGVRKLWKFAGMHVEEETGKAFRRKKGVKSPSCTDLTTVLFKIGNSLIKCGNVEYYDIYINRKNYEEEKHPDHSKLHRHNMARRFMVKFLLKRLYNALVLKKEVSVPSF